MRREYVVNNKIMGSWKMWYNEDMRTVEKKMTMTPAKLEANRRNALLGGKPRGTMAKSTIDAIEARKWAVAFVNARLTPLFEAMYKKAVEGDVMAFKELLDRSWGKSVQAVELSGKDGNPIVFMPLELIQKHALQVAKDVSQSEPVDVTKDAKVL